jgi:hypothetical protein
MEKIVLQSFLIDGFIVHISIERVSEEVSQTKAHLQCRVIRSNSDTCPTHSSAQWTVVAVVAVAALASHRNQSPVDSSAAAQW